MRDNKTDTAAALPRLISTETLAREWDTTEATVRRWARDAALPAIKIGREWRFKVEDLQRIAEGE